MTSGVRGLARTFEAVPESVRDARRFVSDALDSARVDALVEQAVLLVSELVTNAVLHARRPFTVEIDIADDVLRVSVHDPAAGRPSLRRFSETAGSGRGLHLVDTLSTRWGVDDDARTDGKRVWFELDLDAEPALVFDLDAVDQL